MGDRRRRSLFLLLLAVLPFFLCPAPAPAAEKGVAVLLSREIAPYVVMVEGLEARLRAPVHRFFLDEKGSPYSLGGHGGQLLAGEYDALVAVGPEALAYLQTLPGSVPLLFAMVLNPEKTRKPGKAPLCGVSLNIPAEAQFAALLARLPGLRRLGVLFDPANNQEWFAAATAPAAARGIELVPLRVERQVGRLELVGDFAGLDAILFIPDKSIVSKAVIQHVIKQAVLQRTPAVGYNRFFVDSGAALSLLIDYRRVGAQVAAQVERLQAGGKCAEILAPEFELAVNEEVWRKIKGEE